MQPLVGRLAPPTSATVDGDGFLALGAAVGTLGWAGTQALALWGGRHAPLVAAALWLALVGVMGVVGLTRTPDTVRFSRPLAVWGTTNGSATALSAVAVALPGTFPARAVVAAWCCSFLVGYAATARFVGGRGARPYWLGTALATAGLAGVWAAPAVADWGYLVAGTVHVLPLALAVRG